jgi:hypothetical protein
VGFTLFLVGFAFFMLRIIKVIYAQRGEFTGSIKLQRQEKAGYKSA